MSIPETTSTEGLEPYLGGKCLFHNRGDAWRDLKAWIVDQPPEGDTSTLPSISESFIAWTISGEVDFQEREYKRPWITHRIRKGSFFLTTGGAPYDVRWKAVTTEPSTVMNAQTNKDRPLDARQQNIVMISALTATGDLNICERL